MNKYIYIFLLLFITSFGSVKSQDVDNFSIALSFNSNGNKEKCFEYMQKSAYEGNSEAMAYIGFFYLTGYVVDQNIHMAINWLEKAADKDVKWACINLGSIYESEDIDKAIYYYKKGIGNSAAGNIDFTENLARLLAEKEEFVEAIKYWELAAQEGSAISMFYLGHTYIEGADDVPIDYSKAYTWFLKGAEKSERSSMYNLGYMYSNGLGVEENPSEAFKWYLKAANLGDPNAEHNIGYMYAHGEGVAENLSEAIKWYQKSADHGLPLAYRKLGFIFSDSETEFYDMRKAVKNYAKGAEAGDAQCMFELGMCYAMGNGVESDPHKALNLFYNGAQEENADCLYIMGIHYWDGLIVPEDKDKAFDYMLRAIKAGSQTAIKFMYDNYEIH